MGCSGLLFLALFFTQILLQFNLSSAQNYLYDQCLGANYTANSTFGANRNLLLSSISNFNISSNRFYYVFEGRYPDRVYGLFQCRGDYASAECKTCANASTSSVTTRCPFSREAVVIYDECWLRYSDYSFISTLFLDPTIVVRNAATVSDPVRFDAKMEELMERLLVQATKNPLTLFAVDKVIVTSYEMYGLVQCTQDLSADNCTRCLRITIPGLSSCCFGTQGARVVRPSCMARYEIYNFLGTGGITAPPLPPPPPPHINSFLNNINNTTGKEKSVSNKVVTIVASTVSAVMFIFTISVCFYVRSWLKLKNDKSEDPEELSSAESVQFNFRTIREATDDFSDANKLGKGGFGIVYKGVLQDGEEIAVKRLSRNSGQGLEEFENEVLLIVKLQHRNLVRLLGFCLEGYEKLLIYELAPNGSLDQYIFDRTKSAYLDWERRYNIIGGIARGLLYLHEDSRHRIIHRDLKTGNILLDAQMEPKISDFGMARLFRMDQSEGSTARVVGTYGYMAPEYAIYGQFSVKSDVFSFGVLILEIITGLKNKVVFHAEHSEDLLTHAWRHWGAGTAMDIIEPALKGNYSRDEVMRCIHIALLCVQDNVDLRPTMTTVVRMLNRDSAALPLPSTPAFYVNSILEHGEHVSEGNELMDRLINHSINEVSMTELQAR